MYCIAADSDAVRRDDDRVLHRAVLLELAHDVRDRRVLLPDRDVDALKVAALLIDDRVDRDRGLAGLAVADDELALPAADRHHRVDRLQPRLHGLAHGLAVDDAGRHLLDRRGPSFVSIGPLPSIGRPSESTTRPSSAFADRHLEDASRRLDRVALGDVLVVAEHDGADGVLLEVEREPEAVARELDHLAVLHVREPVDAADAVGQRDDRADVARFGLRLEALDPLLDQLADFRSFE